MLNDFLCYLVLCFKVQEVKKLQTVPCRFSFFAITFPFSYLLAPFADILLMKQVISEFEMVK